MASESINPGLYRYHCQPCEMDMLVGNIGTHLAGKKHRTRCALLDAMENGPVSLGTGDVVSEAIPTTAPGTVYCGFCIGGAADGIEKHMAHMPHCDEDRRAKLAASAAADIEPETLDLTAALFTPPIRATEPPSTDSRAAADELHSQYAETRLAPTDSINEVGTTGQEKSKRKKRKVKVKEAIRDEEIQGLIAAGGAALSSKGNLSSVEVSTGGENEIIEASGEEHTRQIDLTTTGQRQDVPQSDSSAPPSAFTLQSQSSTAHLYCDSCARQLKTLNGFVSHMKGATHQRNMEAKIAEGHVETDLHAQDITQQGATAGLGYELVDRKEPGQDNQPLSATEYKSLSLEKDEEHSVKMQLNPQLPIGEPMLSVLMPLQEPTVPEGSADMWYCDTCARFVTVGKRDKHLGSFFHLEQAIFRGEILASGAQPEGIQQTFHEDPTDTAMEDPEALLALPLVSTDSFHCTTCSCTYKLVSYESHINSKSHQSALLLLRPVSTTIEQPATPPISTSDPVPESWFCTSCNIYRRPSDRKIHLASKKHIKRAGSLSADAEGILVLDAIPEVDTFWPSPVGDEEEAEDMDSRQVCVQNLAGDYVPEKPEAGCGDGDGACYCEVCRKDVKHNLRKWHGWYCGVCRVMVHEDRREDHLKRAPHFQRQPTTAETDACVDEIRPSTSSHSGENRDANYCVSCDKQFKNITPHLLSNAHLRKLQNYQPPVTTYESEHDEGRNDSQGAVGEVDSRDDEDFDPLNQLVRRRALEKDGQEQSVTAEAEAEPEIWNCTLCDIEMPPAKRPSHEEHPFHLRRLEQKRQEDGGQPLPRAPSFRCFICITIYSARHRHLHSTPPWHCETCNIIVHTSGKSDHLSSDSHQLKESEPKKDCDGTFKPANNDTFFCLPCRSNIPKSDRKFHYSPPYYCALCEKLMHSDTRYIHEWSIPHSRGVRAATAMMVKSSDRFDCQTCKKDFLIGHQPFHRSRPWTCELCETTIHMDWIGVHLMSDEHVELVRCRDSVGKGKDSEGTARGGN